MRAKKKYKVVLTETLKQQLLQWASQFEEVAWLDSNAYEQKYASYQAILAVDAFTAIKTDYHNGFKQLDEYQTLTNDWLFGYFYAHIEALSLNSSFLQDEWVRWGDANQVRSTNIKGSEFRVLYTINPKMNLFARAFFVDAIDLLEPGDSSKETGNRVRIDFNIFF